MCTNLIFTRKWKIIGNPQHDPHMGPGCIIQSILDVIRKTFLPLLSFYSRPDRILSTFDNPASITVSVSCWADC